MTFPTDDFAECEISQEVDVIAPGPRLRRVKRMGPKAPYWLIALTTPPNTTEKGEEIGAYIDHTLAGVVNFPLPNPKASLVERSGISTSTSAAIGATQIGLRNFTPNQPGGVKAGDFFNFVGDLKTYKIVFTQNADQGGELTATFTPPAMQNIPANTPINYGSAAVFQVSLLDSVPTKVNTDDGQLIVHDLELIEQI